MKRRNLSVIAGGYGHTLRIENGIVWAWGKNDSGQLGIGNTLSTSTPFFVRDLTNIISVSAGHDHSLALGANGKVWVWGSNNSKQLGTASKDSQLYPKPVALGPQQSLEKIKAIAAGAYHNLALSSNSRVLSWGSASSSLGRNLSTAYTPGEVLDENEKPLEDVVAISAGLDHSLALKADGSVWAWGNNSQKQIGNHQQKDIPRAKQVLSNEGVGFTQVKAVSAGSWHNLALKADGSIWAWGSNDKGQLGNNSFQGSGSPVQVVFRPSGLDSSEVPLVGEFTAVSAGHQFSMGLLSSGGVTTWGANEAGQLGYETIRPELPYTSYAILGGKSQKIFTSIVDKNEEKKKENDVETSFIRSIAAGYGHAIALGIDNRIWTWGANGGGQLGYTVKAEAVSASKTMPPLPVMKRFHNSIAAGTNHSATIKGTNVWCWGTNNKGQIGNGRPGRNPFPSSTSEPTQVVKRDGSPLSKIVALSAGANHTLALDVDGAVWAWGENNIGQVGNKSKLLNVSFAVPVNTKDRRLSNIMTIGTASDSSFAVQNNGSIWVWGQNAVDQLGVGKSYGTLLDINYAIKQSPLNFMNQSLVNIFFVFVAGGQSHGLALDSHGQIWTWGDSPYGGLGLGGGHDISVLSNHVINIVPTRVSSPTRIHFFEELFTDFSLFLRADQGLELDNGIVDSTIRTKLEQEGYKISSNIHIEKIIAKATNSNAGLQDNVWIITDKTNNWTFRVIKSKNRVKADNYGIKVYISKEKHIISISAGGGGRPDHGLALTDNGDVWTWGFGTPIRRIALSHTTVYPSKKEELRNIAVVYAGSGSNFALGVDGKRWTWGFNDDGQLGIQATIPFNQSNDRGVSIPRPRGNQRTIAPGRLNHTLFQDNTLVSASGDTVDGKLGPESLKPGHQEKIAGTVESIYISGVLSLSGGGDHSLALRDNGNVWAWGNNFFNEIGNQQFSAGLDALKPVIVDSIDLNGDEHLPLKNAGKIHASYAQSLAIVKESGISGVWEWGLSRVSSEATNSATIEAKRLPPFSSRLKAAKELQNSICISGWGWDNNYILTAKGEVFSAGLNKLGESGNGNNTPNINFSKISLLKDILSVVSGPLHVLALSVTGEVWAWGNNNYGQLGSGNFTSSNKPIKVLSKEGRPLKNVIAISAGQEVSIALDARGSIWSWGSLSESARVNVPTQMELEKKKVSDIVAIAYGRQHGLALDVSGGVSSWGRNEFGQLGIGEISSFRATLTPIKGSALLVSNVSHISAGDFHSLSLRPDNTVGVWGKNIDGQLGLGVRSSGQSIPKQGHIGRGKR